MTQIVALSKLPTITIKNQSVFPQLKCKLPVPHNVAKDSIGSELAFVFVATATPQTEVKIQ